jgi:uncharacterized membrane protein
MRLLPSLNMWLFSICALFLFATPASAQWTICNKTGYPVVLAIGHEKNDQWISEGWWHILGGHCTEVISGELRKRYYFYYAEHVEIGGEWNGNYPFCVSHNSFTIVGDKNCERRGYTKKNFRRTDTGQSKSRTTNLTDE